MAERKKYIEIRFQLLPEEFAPYEEKAEQLKKELGIKTSGTAQIKALAIKNANVQMKQSQPQRKLTPLEELGLSDI